MKKRLNMNTVEQKFASFFREQRRMPTYSEMLPLLGVRAKSAAEYWTKKLRDRGALEKDAKGFLKPARLSFNLPLAGYVAAGFPPKKNCGTPFPLTSILSVIRHHPLFFPLPAIP